MPRNHRHRHQNDPIDNFISFINGEDNGSDIAGDIKGLFSNFFQDDDQKESSKNQSPEYEEVPLSQIDEEEYGDLIGSRVDVVFDLLGHEYRGTLRIISDSSSNFVGVLTDDGTFIKIEKDKVRVIREVQNQDENGQENNQDQDHDDFPWSREVDKYLGELSSIFSEFFDHPFKNPDEDDQEEKKPETDKSTKEHKDVLVSEVPARNHADLIGVDATLHVAGKDIPVTITKVYGEEVVCDSRSGARFNVNADLISVNTSVFEKEDTNEDISRDDLVTVSEIPAREWKDIFGETAYVDETVFTRRIRSGDTKYIPVTIESFELFNGPARVVVRPHGNRNVSKSIRIDSVYVLNPQERDHADNEPVVDGAPSGEVLAHATAPTKDNPFNAHIDNDLGIAVDKDTTPERDSSSVPRGHARLVLVDGRVCLGIRNFPLEVGSPHFKDHQWTVIGTRRHHTGHEKDKNVTVLAKLAAV